MFSDLVQSNLKVNIVHWFGAFVDKVGILKDVLHDKRTTEDVLHINETGYKIIVKCIKTDIFDVKRLKASSPQLDYTVMLLGVDPLIQSDDRFKTEKRKM